MIAAKNWFSVILYVGHLWVSLIIDQSECLVRYLFFALNELFSALFKKKSTALNQSEWRIFFMYIMKVDKL